MKAWMSVNEQLYPSPEQDQADIAAAVAMLATRIL